MSRITLSLVANVVVIVPLLTLALLGGLMGGLLETVVPPSPVALAIGYGAILLASVALLQLGRTDAANSRLRQAAQVLLGLQVAFAVAIALIHGIADLICFGGLLLAALHVYTLFRG